jgi:hypothetical protein
MPMPRLPAGRLAFGGGFRNTAGMKRMFGCLALAVALSAAGCARYNVTLTNGSVITAKSKPKLDPTNNCYRFKDASDKEILVPSVRIRQIERR